MYTVVNPELVNALKAIVVTEFGIVIDVNKLQVKNALVPILVSVEVGVNITELNFAQLKNAALPILVTELPIVIVVNAVQF